MKKLLFALIVLISTSTYAQNDEIMKKLIAVKNEIQQITQKDNSSFWNIPYETPLLFVNPENRQTYAFDIGTEPYKIRLDDNILIANTAIKWKEKLWAMVQIPLPENPFAYEILILHEMFHALQPQLGFGGIYENPCTHLEQKEARILLRLELKALSEALVIGISYNSIDSILFHLTNALTFRNIRYNLYPEAKEKENNLELNEGIAEYTAFMMLQNYSENKQKFLASYFHNCVSKFLEHDSYVRSFAYETIPIYGYLMQYFLPNWHQKINTHTNLTDFFIKEANIKCHEGWEHLIPLYDNNIQVIIKQEDERVEQLSDLENKVLKKFKGANHVEIPLFQFSYSFDPMNVIVLESIGEFHLNAIFTDNWGKLEVSKGLILDKENMKIFLSPATQIKKNKKITGDGWKLILNKGWRINQENKIEKTKQ
jgi:hypothetical protein